MAPDRCGKRVRQHGGEIVTNLRVHKIVFEQNRVVGVEASDTVTGEMNTFFGDYLFSTIPVKELVRTFDREVPENDRHVSEGLIYRDFVTVGLLLSSMTIHKQSEKGGCLLCDNWIYIQEPDVRVGRMQIFNNWSP